MDKLQTYWVELLLLGTILLSLCTGNKTMGISAGVVLLLRLIHAQKALEVLSTNGANWGIVFLTVAIFAPMALDKYDFHQLISVIQTPPGWIAIVCGVLVTVLGTKGMQVSTTDLTIVLGVTLGSVVGVVLFRGTPMGPLIGSGMAAAVVVLVRTIFRF